MFEASVPVSESRSANYDGHSIVHLPTDIWSYRNTSGRHFSVAGKLVSRNASEMKANLHYIDLIRAWVLPSFGASGSTPPIIKFSAFNNLNIKGVPCIIRSYSINFADDVDWVFDSTDPNSAGLPVICFINIELDEAYSPSQVTAGAWKMNTSGPTGSFVYGNVYGDNTSAGGGQHSEQQPAPITPVASQLTSTYNGTSGSINGQPNGIMPLSPGNGSLAGTYGVTSDGRIVDQTALTNSITPNDLSTLYNPNPPSIPAITSSSGTVLAPPVIVNPASTF
jgi:hypothetical protein